MMKQGLEIDGKEFFVIVKMEEDSVHYLCRNESSDVPSLGEDGISVDFIHVDVVKWSPVFVRVSATMDALSLHIKLASKPHKIKKNACIFMK